MKKILLVVHELTYSGAPRSTLNLAIVLRKIFQQVDIWSLKDGAFRKEFTDHGFEISIASESEEPSALENKLKNYDVVIANTIFCTHFAFRCQKYVKTVLYIREAKNITDLIQVHNIDEKELESIKYIICLSEYAYYFIKQYHTAENIYIVHNYVEDKKYRLRLHKPRQNIYILVAGTLEYRKGYDIVIKALNKMDRKEKNRICFFVMGRIVEWDYDYAVKIIDDENTIYLGEISDEKAKYQLFNKMDYFIIPSRDEACSLVALEGAMLGKGLIVSENVGAKYLVNSSNGFIYKTEDVDGLSEIFKNIIKDNIIKSKSKIRGYYSRKMYKKFATKKAYKERISDVLSEIMVDSEGKYE